MSGFVKRNTVNPAGGVNPASSPNVGQYGWTSYDAANVNQLIQYVDMAKEAAISAKESADFVSSKFFEIEAFIQYVEDAYEQLKPVLDGLTGLYEDVVLKHGEVVTMHKDVRTWSVLAVASATSAKDSADEAKAEVVKAEASAAASAVSASNSKVAETGSKDWYDKSKELYDDLKEGQVYRGTWNPVTNAYPTKPDTNSAWDVSLPSGTASHVFDGKEWRSGDRLLFAVATQTFEQLAVGGGVDSVNGKSGAVTLNAADVGAVDSTGGVITGSVQITGASSFRMTDPDAINIRLITSSGNGYIQAGHSTDDANQKMILSGMNGKGLTDVRFQMNDGVTPSVRWGTKPVTKIYHEGFKPTATDVGALGNTGTQTLNGELRAVKFIASDSYGFVSSTRLYQGMYMGKTDGDRRTIIGGGGDAIGDGLGTVLIRPNGITDTIGVTLFNANGTISNSNAPTHVDHLANKRYVDSSIKTVSDKVDAISPDAINAMPKTGGAFTGPVFGATGVKGALTLANGASARFYDGNASWFHNYAEGNYLKWGSGTDGSTPGMTLSSTGLLETQNAVYGRTGVISRNQANTGWLSIETPETDAPYIASKTPAEGANSVAMRFGQSEISSTKIISAPHVRIANDGGLKFSASSDLNGRTWGMGINNTQRTLGLYSYVNGGYEGVAMEFDNSGNSIFYKNMTVKGQTYMGSYASLTSATNNILEFHQPGNSAVMVYKPVNTANVRLAQSNGAGGEAAWYANFSADTSHHHGRVVTDSGRGRTWGEAGISRFYGNGINVAPGQLGALVAQWVQVPGQVAYEQGFGFLSDQSGNIGNFGHAMWCQDSGAYLKYWIFRNNGGQQSPSGFRIDPAGRMAGDAYAGYEDNFHWSTAAYGATSDERLKTVLGDTKKSALDIVNQFQFKRFVWNEKAGKVYSERNAKVTEIGLIAQQVESVDPVLVKTVTVGGENPSETKTLDTAAMLALAMKAIQEQQAQINELKEKLNAYVLK